MAGVKGRSGGARPNSGGYRPGAGRPRKEPEIIKAPENYTDPMKFLEFIMNDDETDVRIRADAAKALMPFVHQKLGEGGKKEQKQKDAEKVASKFVPVVAPRLVAAGGNKV